MIYLKKKYEYEMGRFEKNLKIEDSIYKIRKISLNKNLWH
jgi:hypothetical protein